MPNNGGFMLDFVALILYQELKSNGGLSKKKLNV